MPHRDTSLTISVNTDTSNQLMNVSTIRHDPHGYNPATTQGAILLAINVNTDISNQFMDVSTNRHDPHGYNPVTNQHPYTRRDLDSYRCQYRH